MKRFDVVRKRWLVLLLAVLALVAAGCGSSSSSSSPAASAASSASAPASSSSTSSVHLAKTKFVLHAGLAFGAFHRWIYKPVKAGDLAHPLDHKAALAKGALAAAFVYHELKLALANAQADPTLSKLVSPITALQDKIKGIGSGLKSGTLNPADVSSANDAVGSIKQQASSAGQPITEQTPPAP